MPAKIVDFLTAGDKEQAAYILAAAALSEPLAGAAMKVPGAGAALQAVTNALASVSPTAASAIAPIVPNLVIAVGAELIGQKMGQKKVQAFGKALMITNIVDLGEAIGSLLASAVGLQGVDYTAMRGVDFTMGRHRRGVGAVPRGIAAVPSMRGLTSHDRADFGAGSSDSIVTAGGTLKTAADFGRQMADFGGVDYTMGMVPSMRGAHTMDAQIADGSDDSDNPDESADHTV